MVTVRRKRKRNWYSPMNRYYLVGALVLAALLVALSAYALIGRMQAEGRIDDMTDIMAKAVRTDLNQAVQAYDALGRKSNDSAGETLSNMKRFMYSAFRVNQLLVSMRGERYSVIDTATYNNFQTIVGEYERLLANGQSTAGARTSLGDYMSALSTSLSQRFDSADALIPQATRR